MATYNFLRQQPPPPAIFDSLHYQGVPPIFVIKVTRKDAL